MKENDEVVEFRFYQIAERYISYLLQYDTEVMYNYENGGYVRPYVGVLIQKNSFYYFVPLSSYKENSFVNRNTSIKVFDITEKKEQKQLSWLMLGKMIPVPLSEVIHMELNDIQLNDKGYYDLLTKEHIFINKNKKRIIKRANVVYDGVCKKRSDMLFHSCDFLKLEGKCKLFSANSHSALGG